MKCCFLQKLLTITCLFFSLFLGVSAESELPLDMDKLNKCREITSPSDKDLDYPGVINLFSLQMLNKIITGAYGGLNVDFSKIDKLLDENKLNSDNIRGNIYVGAYPFRPDDVKCSFKRFAVSAPIVSGHGVVPLDKMLLKYNNSNKFVDNGTIVIRLEISIGNKYQGYFDIFTAFEKKGNYYERAAWLSEGPYVCLADSRQPDEITIFCRTDQPSDLTLSIIGFKDYETKGQLTHKIKVKGLKPDTEYRYKVKIGNIETPEYSFKTAPLSAKYPVVFAIGGDCRSNPGGPSFSQNGVNYSIIENIIQQIYAKGAEFYIAIGDQQDGYTMSKEDFISMLRTYKQSISGYWKYKPVYAIMGNHETLFNKYRCNIDGKEYNEYFDKWPYDKSSSEAVFAAEFVNPENGPEPSDKKRPPYKGNVFTLQYGPVRIIGFNNNYWTASHAPAFGGNPHGCFLEDQLKWIELELEQAQIDSSVRYTILLGHDPMYPSGTEARMFRFGDNNIRAYLYENGKLVPQKQGMIEQRNRLTRAAAKYSKLAAVIVSHEHNYAKLLVNKNLPTGIPSKDDLNHDGYISYPKEGCSPLTDLNYPFWHIVTGGGGSPMSVMQDAPWVQYCLKMDDPEKYYKFSVQYHFLLFKAYQDKLTMEVYDLYGKLIDKTENLMDIKK